MVRRVRSLSPATRAICPATASEDAMPDPLSRIRRKLDCLKPISVTGNTPQPVRKEMIDPLLSRPRSSLARTSTTASPTWSPARTVASASYGPCPQNSSDRIRAPGAFSSDGGSSSGDGDRCLWMRRTSARSQPVNSRPSGVFIRHPYGQDCAERQKAHPDVNTSCRRDES